MCRRLGGSSVVVPFELLDGFAETVLRGLLRDFLQRVATGDVLGRFPSEPEDRGERCDPAPCFDALLDDQPGGFDDEERDPGRLHLGGEPNRGERCREADAEEQAAHELSPWIRSASLAPSSI